MTIQVKIVKENEMEIKVNTFEIEGMEKRILYGINSLNSNIEFNNSFNSKLLKLVENLVLSLDINNGEFPKKIIEHIKKSFET